ncbi:hypothetical protein ACFUIT_36350 [Streptomyces sp. NPDC057239]|uniref:phthiocerol/phthiodiolone dimycocerosyl transferase family protein n=1 Tax=Streptomyces sp. NPDC057239 TaxID=3346061 RepID=UPI0036328926
MAASEAMMVPLGLPLVIGHSLHGPVDPSALDHALAAVAALHPVLTARCLPDSSGNYLLRREPGPEPPRLTIGGSLEAAVAPIAPGGPLLRASLLRDDDGGRRFVLTVHHAVSDGTSAMSLLASLWESYTACITGRPACLPPPAGALPEPVELHFRDRYSEDDIADYLQRRRARLTAVSRVLRLPPAHPHGLPGTGSSVHYQRLDLDRAAGLQRIAGSGPHGLMCGIVITAIHALARPAEPTAAVCLSPVDLRPRMTPRHPRHHLAMAIAVLEATVEPSAVSDPLAAGRQIWDQLKTSTLSGDAGRAIAAMPHVIAEIAASPMTAVISNVTSRTPTLSMPPGLSYSSPWGYTPPPGPVPAVFFGGRPDGGITAHVTLPQAWFSATQADELTAAIRDTTERVLSEQ